MSHVRTVFRYYIRECTMYLPIQGFISSFRLLDVVDILLVAFFLYKMLILIRNTRAVALIKGLIVLGAVTVISSSRFLNLHVINWMLQQGMMVIMFALPVVFQPELRRVLEQIGRGRLIRSSQVRLTVKCRGNCWEIFLFPIRRSTTERLSSAMTASWRRGVCCRLPVTVPFRRNWGRATGPLSVSVNWPMLSS